MSGGTRRPNGIGFSQLERTTASVSSAGGFAALV